MNKTVGINDHQEAEYSARKKGKTLLKMLDQKAKSLDFEIEISKNDLLLYSMLPTKKYFQDST